MLGEKVCVGKRSEKEKEETGRSEAGTLDPKLKC